MTDAEVRALIVRANQAGHESLAEYAAALEDQNQRLDAALDAAVEYIETLEEQAA